MNRLELLGLAFSLSLVAACGGTGGGTSGGAAGEGGAAGGGNTATAGSAGTGGSTAMGGAAGTGGAPGTGGGAGMGGNAGGSGGGMMSSGSGMIMECDPQDPMSCPTGQGCACGGPGPSVSCTRGDLCAKDADCTDPARPVCCGGGSGAAGVCTDACTCFCD